jgi:hypothetical protein
MNCKKIALVCGEENAKISGIVGFDFLFDTFFEFFVSFWLNVSNYLENSMKALLQNLARAS